MKVGKRKFRSNRKTREKKGWPAVYLGPAYVRATLPSPEVWHRFVPPWEDRPTFDDEAFEQIKIAAKDMDFRRSLTVKKAPGRDGDQ